MGLERYVCVGGVEVANPSRTLAYMRALGNSCQPNPPGPCCSCPDWELPPCTGFEFVPSGLPPFEPDPDAPDDNLNPPMGAWRARHDLGPKTIEVRFTTGTTAHPTSPPGTTLTKVSRGTPRVFPPAGLSSIDPAVAAIMEGDGLTVAAADTSAMPEITRLVTGGQGDKLVVDLAVHEPSSGFSVLYLVSWSTPWGAVDQVVELTPFGFGFVLLEDPMLSTEYPSTVDYTSPSNTRRSALAPGSAEPGDDGPCGSFTTPEADDAPWYDPAVPESADVLGVWIEEARVSNPWARTMRKTLRGGSLSPGTLSGRELQLIGWVYTRSEAASWYARQWLFEALAGDGCAGGYCDLPDAEVWTHCDPEAPGAGRRFLKRVGLTAFDPDLEPEFPRRCGFKFDATLSSEVPEMFLAPTTVIDGALLSTPEAICNLCNPCPEPTAPCSCGGLAEPPRAVQQPDAASVFCTPIEVKRSVFTFEPPNYWRDGTLVITVGAGQDGADLEAPLANLRIRGWANPSGVAADDVSLMECQEPCIDVEVGCIPARSQLVIDGTTHRAVVLCNGEEQNAFAYLSSGDGGRFQWPDVSCYGLLVAVDADAYNTPANATVSVDFVLRERG